MCRRWRCSGLSQHNVKTYFHSLFANQVFIGGQDILSVIRNAWSAGVGKPGGGFDELYLVYLPPYKHIGDKLTCSGCVGIHAGLYFAELGLWSAGALVETGDAHGNPLSLEAITSVASHEFAEAVTDPYATTFFAGDTSHEIGDLCEDEIAGRQAFRTIVGGYQLSKLWDQYNSQVISKCQPGR